ncbi:hypothetical protein [Streptomyces sp. WMMC940]|uniref:hypothetical protein n=1 Tax=Streptomyces sp. WMMC940 TaxID=3015153 RepID=UPI0022B66404|nr:hypothetical protein [Streptomyces sp. WMMC940]MCZ7458434.1 hypothetical protein [Streptomyces sp. WMMC940]
MADERYEWLDQEAAERLLRGEPVEPLGVDARHQALRLAELLDDARAQEPVTEPLRGEDAALAAFRKARDGGAAELLPTVRLTPETRPVSWSRSLRWGLAASLTGFAVGGVAVAAGVGVLPTPFGGPQPAPASSVSGAVTPGPVTSEPAPDELRSPDLPSPADTPSPSAPAASGGTDTPDGPGDGQGAGPGRDESTAPHDSRTDGGTNGRDWYRKTADACRDYRNGTLDEERKRKLEAAAQGADRVKRFCDRMLSADGRGDDGGKGGDDGEGDDGDGGGDDGDDDGSGPVGFPRSPFLPPTSVRPGTVERPLVPPTSVRPAFRPAVPGASVPGPSLPGESGALPAGGRLPADAVRTLPIATL